ncbi:hypothetical protein ACVW6E_000091 [Escherichia coli]
MDNQPFRQQNPGIVQHAGSWIKHLIATVFTFRASPKDRSIDFVYGLPANLFINRLTDASILVSGSDDAMHKNLEACVWRGQVGVAMATSLKA